MTALAMDVRELTASEVDYIAGGPVPVLAAIGIRAAAGGLVAGTVTAIAASADGEITQQEVANIGGAVVAGAISGALGGVFSRLRM